LIKVIVWQEPSMRGPIIATVMIVAIGGTIADASAQTTKKPSFQGASTAGISLPEAGSSARGPSAAQAGGPADSMDGVKGAGIVSVDAGKTSDAKSRE
jgi:hypothetical protein